MRKLTTYIKENKIIIQQADYIEDGWYIEIVDNIITLTHYESRFKKFKSSGCIIRNR